MTLHLSPKYFLPSLAVIAFLPIAFGQGNSFEVLYSFSGSDGANPVGPPVIGEGGALFGATTNGGNAQDGTVFKLVPPPAQGSAWAESVLHSFLGAPDGAGPTGVTLASDGVLFGCTRSGGVNNAGAVFQLKPPAKAGEPWSESIVHSFGSGSDGSDPLAGVTLGPDGVLFGTTWSGGAHNAGIVFKLTPPASSGDMWTEQVIYSFKQPANPYASLTLTQSGVLLGTGSGEDDPYAESSAFALIPPSAPGGEWTFATLHGFGTASAESPLTTRGMALFGSTLYGGLQSNGTVYELLPTAAGTTPWTEQILYSFPASNGAPSGKLVFGRNSVLFGSTQGAGTESGSVYSLTPPSVTGGSWTFTLLHSLSGAIDGDNPAGGLTRNSAGTLFGFAHDGGANFSGTVFAFHTQP